MFKWIIQGTDDFYRVTQINLLNGEQGSFNSNRPMKLVQALDFVMESARLGDVIVLPDNYVCSVSSIKASA